MIVVTTKIENADLLINKFRRFPQEMRQVVDANFQTLGIKVINIMQRKLQVARATGREQGSISAEYDPGQMTLEVGPTAEHAKYTFYGTRPHWAPIAPLKEWANLRFGDESIAYKVRWSIHLYGTSRGYLGKPGAYIGPTGGIGLDFLRLTVEDGNFKSNLTNTARRIGTDLVAKTLMGP